MTADDFARSFQEFLGKNGWPTGASPAAVLGAWEGLIEQCADCYDSGFYEFDNDVRVRTLLERALNEPRLAAYPEQMGPVRARVEAADRRFRELSGPAQIRDADTPWWLRAVLARAGEEYCEDMKRLYGIDVLSC